MNHTTSVSNTARLQEINPLTEPGREFRVAVGDVYAPNGLNSTVTPPVCIESGHHAVGQKIVWNRMWYRPAALAA